MPAWSAILPYFAWIQIYGIGYLNALFLLTASAGFISTAAHYQIVSSPLREVLGGDYHGNRKFVMKLKI